MNENNESALKRMRSGKKAQSSGVLFERIFSIACKRGQEIAVTRMPDGCKVLRDHKLIRVKTPFDWILSYQGRTALIDTKSSTSAAFPNSKIERHQVLDMLEHEKKGVTAGYVIWFRVSDEVIFVPASSLVELLKKRGSILYDCDFGIPLGKASSRLNAKLIFSRGGHGEEKTRLTTATRSDAGSDQTQEEAQVSTSH